ncbi:MAG: T9SS type A sorting domain-containing protein [Bacteroidota bacterium]
MSRNSCQDLNTTAADCGPDYTQASYPCSASDNDMWVSITLTACSHLTLTATESISGNVNVMLLKDCSTIIESGCGSGAGAGVSITGEYLPAGTYFAVVSGASATGTIRLCNSVTSAGSAPSNDACGSPITLTAGNGYNDDLGGASNALTGTNFCATATNVTVCGTANQDSYTYVDMATCYITNYSNPGLEGANPCWGSVENNVWYQFTAPTTDNYYFELFSQSCNTPNGVQFLVTTVKNCSNAEATAGGLMTALSGGSGGYACTSTSTTNNIYLEVNLTAGTTYYISVDGFAGSACSYELMAGIVQAIPLALNVKSFTGKSVDGGNLIEWVIGDLKATKSYVLEKSHDGINFSNVDVLKSTNSDKGSFKFLDENVEHEKTYYRVSVFDDNNTSKERTEVISVNKSDKKDIALFSVYPNPSESNVTISFHSDNAIDKFFYIYNSTGKLVKEIIVIPQVGLNEFEIETALFEKGIYQLILVSTNQTDKIKFIKN